jgi:hypothetical protein
MRNWTVWLKTWLVLISLHSFVVGICLMFIPTALFEQFGFAAIGERFFPAQGGIFHIIMAAVYLFGSRNPVRFESLILLAIGAKLTALLFLLCYFLLVDQLVVVLLSGVGDGIMCLILWLLWHNWSATQPERNVS